jgi:hypothetical protein
MTSKNSSKDIDTVTLTIRSILQLATVGVLIGMLLGRDATNLPSTIIGLCVVLLLWLIAKTNATPLLVTFQLVLLFREPNRPGTDDGFGSALYVAVVLGLLMFFSRDQSLKGLISRTLTDLLKIIFGTSRETPTTIIPAERSPAVPMTHPATSFVRRVVGVLVCVILSQLVLTSFGLDGGAEVNPSVPYAERLLKPVPRLLILTVVTVILFSELAWRRLTPRQPSMYLRTTQVSLLYSDLCMIVKSRRDRLRRQEPATTTVES